jgi:hypothetical protein
VGHYEARWSSGWCAWLETGKFGFESLLGYIAKSGEGRLVVSIIYTVQSSRLLFVISGDRNIVVDARMLVGCSVSWKVGLVGLTRLSPPLDGAYKSSVIQICSLLLNNSVKELAGLKTSLIIGPAILYK